MKITLPHKFKPRDYQIRFWNAADEVKRCFWVLPRRHGKDKTMFNKLIEKAVQRTGNYFYIFPEYAQGKKALWDNIDSQGLRTIDHAPRELVVAKNNTEMMIKLINGSTIQIIGASNVDRVVGSNPAGVVFSEYSLIDPMVWGYIAPMLLENKGFAWFNCTPRGNNHAKKMLDTVKNNPEWFTEHLDAKQCNVFSKDELEKIRGEYFDLYGDYNLFDQEFMTSFDAPVMGAYYAVHIKRAEDDNRITSVPYDGASPVITAWDLGIGDSMAIWFYQAVGKEIHLIDYYENSGEGIAHYANIVNSKGYSYQKHYWPHDGKARELGTGKTREEVAREHGLNVEIIPMHSIDDGIEAVRGILSKCWFDAVKCQRGIEALKNYSKDFDEKNKVYRNRPKHDWASNGCLTADTLITTKSGDKKIKDVRPGDYVLTPNGYAKVKNAGVTRMADSYLVIKTTQGSIKVTGEHKIFTDSGLVYADDLRYGDIIWTHKYHKKSNLITRFLGYRKAQTITGRGLVASKKGSIVKYGSIIMAKYQKTFAFTTKMATSLTTILKTLSQLIIGITAEFILSNDTKRTSIGTKRPEQEILTNTQGLPKTLKELKHFSQRQLRWQRSGISQTREDGGTVNTAKKRGETERHSKRLARFVRKIIRPIIRKDQSFAPHIVSIKIENLSRNIPVYDLEIEHDRCYFANGLLVSNSDSFRYLAMSYKELKPPQIIPRYKPKNFMVQ